MPELTGRTVDRAEILSPAAEAALEALLAGLEQATGAQLAVLTVPALGGEPIESYSLRVAESWGLGSRERDDGLLLLVAPAERRVRIEVGYGLEAALPDVVAGRIIRDSIAPHFHRGDYDAGVLAGAQQIVERLAPGAVEAPPPAQSGKPSTAALQPRRIDWELVLAFTVFLLLMPLAGSVYGLVARTAEARGIIFGVVLMPIFLGGSLVADELLELPPDSGKHLLGGVAAVVVLSGLFWWLHARLRRRPEAHEHWRRRLDELADGRLGWQTAAALGLPLSALSERWAKRLRWALVALFHAAMAVAIGVLWSRGFALFFLFNLFWLWVAYRGALHPSPTSGSARGWSRRSARRSRSTPRSWSRSSSGGSSLRTGGGSFGGGGATGSW